MIHWAGIQCFLGLELMYSLMCLAHNCTIVRLFLVFMRLIVISLNLVSSYQSKVTYTFHGALRRGHYQDTVGDPRIELVQADRGVEETSRTCHARYLIIVSFGSPPCAKKIISIKTC